MSAIEHLMSRVKKDPSTGCWLWQGARGGLGYGQVAFDGKRHMVHRLTYRLFRGEIPEGQQACHSCDTPRCCNPDHIFLGTAQDNARDSVRKGRHYLAAKTECNRGHQYGKHGYIDANGRRSCHQCDRERWRRQQTGLVGVTNRLKTHCKRGHPLSGANLYVVASDGRRQCRKCRLAVVTRIAADRARHNGSEP